MDMDYVTTKRVIIRSRRAVLFYYIALFGLLCYFIIYELLLSNAYMAFQIVPVTTTVQAQQPTQMNGTRQALCDTILDDCHSNFTNLAELPYCQQSTKRFNYTKRHCIRMDALENDLHIGSGAMLLTTQWEFLNQVVACPLETSTCSGPDLYTNVERAPRFSYVADIERWWIWIDHRLGGNRANVIGSSFRTQGYVQTPGGHVEKMKMCKDVVDKKERDNMFCSDEYGDHLHVGKLIRLLGIDMDALDPELNKTTRESGFILHMDIHYSNHRPFELARLFSGGYGELTYTYQVEATTLDMVSKESRRSLDGDVPSGKRMRARQYGILVKAQGDASIGVFQFSTLLLVMVQFSAMLTVAVTATDYLVRMPWFVGKHSAAVNDTYLREYSVHEDKVSRKQLAELADKRRKSRDHEEILKAHEIQLLDNDSASDSED